MYLNIIGAALSLVLLSNVQACKEKKQSKSDVGSYTESQTDSPNTSGKATTMDTVKKNTVAIKGESQSQTGSEQNSTGAEENYRLVVQFYSKGAGTDYKTREKYDAWLQSYKPAINVEKTPWGREGELDYCMKLSELDNAEQAEFINKTRDFLSKSELVHIKENTPCRYKRK